MSPDLVSPDLARRGDDGWSEERARMVDRIKDLPLEERGDPLNVYAIAELMPTWRAWGQVLGNLTVVKTDDSK